MRTHYGTSLGFLLCTLGALQARAQIFQGVLDGQTVFGNDIINTPDCGFQVVGRATFPSAGRTYAYSANLAGNGKVAWAKAYRTTSNGNSIAFSLVRSSLNEDLILGCDMPQAAPGNSCVIVRTDNAGDPIWGTRLSGTDGVISLGRSISPGFAPICAVETFKNHIATTGRLSNSNGVARLGVLSSLDSNGGLDFSKRYVPGGGSAAELDFVQVREAKASQGELLVLGTIRFSVNYYGLYAMRTDSAGNIIWANTYLHPDGVTSLDAGGFALARNGDILFSAGARVLPVTSGSPHNGAYGRIDSLTGTPLWSSTVDGFTCGFQAVFATPDDEMLVAGLSGLVFDTAPSVVRLDNLGFPIELWQYGDLLPNARGLADAIVPITPSGGYAIFGETQEISPNGFAYLIRTYSTLSSGCHEQLLHPTGSGLSLVVHQPSPQVIDDAVVEPEEIVTETLDSNIDYRCLTSACIGDLNGDGLVDDSDFVLFAGAYDILVCPTDPSIGCCPADFNNDGLVDDSDFVLFASAYDALLCP